MRYGILGTIFVRVSAVALLAAMMGVPPAEAGGARKASWNVAIRHPSGSALGQELLQDGTTGLKLRTNTRYRWSAKVPRRVLKDPNGEARVALEVQVPAQSEEWRLVRFHDLKQGRRLEGEFEIDHKRLTARRQNYRYRLSKDLTKSGQEVVSEVLGAAVSTQINIKIINETKSNLNIYLPSAPNTSASNGNFTEQGFYLAQGAYRWVSYQDIQGPMAFHARAQRDKCGLICDNYVIHWENSPGNYTSCKDAGINIVPGQNYYVQIKPQAFSSGFDLFVWGDSMPVCTGELSTGLVTWIQNNTAEFILIDLAVAAVVGTVAVAILCPECLPVLIEGEVQEFGATAAGEAGEDLDEYGTIKYSEWTEDGYYAKKDPVDPADWDAIEWANKQFVP